MDWTIGNYWALAFLPIVLGMGLLISRFIRWRNSRKEEFATQQFRDFIFQKTSGHHRLIPLVYLLGLLFLVLALADVLKGSTETKTKQKMNNVIFLLDVSNSMNAEDVNPNRLEQGKNIILNALHYLKNDRVGVVVFAGDAQSIMPLTSDFSSVDSYIEAINTGIIKKQGTDFLSAMQEVVKKFKNIPKGSRQVVLISDGEDNENNLDKAIQLAKEEGIHIITIGIGTKEGAPIPEYIMGQLMGYKEDNTNGETILSSLKDDDLKKIATETQGEYIDGNSIKPALAQIQTSLKKVQSETTSWVSSENAERYYQYFLGISLCCFLIIFLFNPKSDLNL